MRKKHTLLVLRHFSIALVVVAISCLRYGRLRAIFFTSNQLRQFSNAQAGRKATTRTLIASREALIVQKNTLSIEFEFRWIIMDAGLMTSDIVLAMHSQPREVGNGPGLSVRAIPVRPRLV